MLLVVKPTHAVEHFAGSEGVKGSIPLGSSNITNLLVGFLAQLVKQLTLNHQVEGSNPSGPTVHRIKRNGSDAVFLLFGKLLIVSFIAFPMVLMMTKECPFLLATFCYNDAIIK